MDSMPMLLKTLDKVHALLGLKKKKLSDTHYIFKDIPVRNEFGMIATIHTFTRPKMESTHPLPYF